MPAGQLHPSGHNACRVIAPAVADIHDGAGTSSYYPLGMSRRWSQGRHPSSPRACLFCDATGPLTDEHVYGKWLRKLGYAGEGVRVTNLDADLRLIASPVTRTLDDEAVRLLAYGYANGNRDGDGVPESRPLNVVVLMPRMNAAQAWARYANQTWRVGDLEAEVTALRRGHVGLVVLVNKHDGVDLPGSACELLVIDCVPRPLDAWERREAVALADSPAGARGAADRAGHGPRRPRHLRPLRGGAVRPPGSPAEAGTRPAGTGASCGVTASRPAF
ncbi:hypothetical protein EAS64_10655 [Trebonia kvetii]|uniref:Uncharacterized protein n=1 Tax=Trebonia kvetii TaxID=2480626 RepID=A0A6P2C4G9_9ACTN|nr:hypothetical protein [Trebonia kvetii]TVZ05071.1 hypothetical protein EAS64_10655 [Trebonia kvetii]